MNVEKEIRESVELDGSRVDREKSIIYDVAVLGKNSKHGHEYSDAALTEGQSYFDSAPVFIEHRKQKEVKDLAGELKNLKVVEGKLRGNLRVTQGHNYLLDLAENFPNQIGLSIMATGRMSSRTGKQVIEGFSPGKQRSVDLVIGPATLKNLFEQHTEVSNEMEELKELKEQVERLTTEKADLEKRLEESVNTPKETPVDSEKALLEQVCGLEKRLAEQEKKTLDEQLKREQAERGSMIDRKLREAKVEPSEAFRMLLEKCSDEKEIDSAIEDRKQVSTSSSRNLRSTPVNEKQKDLRESVKAALK